MLPIVLILFGAIVLLGAVAAIWQSLRAAFGALDEQGLAASTGSMKRVGLLDEKRQLLENIHDLKFDHDIGKISDRDYKKLDGEMRLRAKEVLKLLDQDVAPYRREAESLVDKRLAKIRSRSPYRERVSDHGDIDEEARESEESSQTLRCPKCTTRNDVDADWCKSCRARLTDRECPKCETLNDADAAFCKKCATQLDAGPEPEEAPEVEAKEARPKKRKKPRKKKITASGKKKVAKMAAESPADETSAAEAVAEDATEGSSESEETDAEEVDSEESDAEVVDSEEGEEEKTEHEAGDSDDSDDDEEDQS